MYPRARDEWRASGGENFAAGGERKKGDEKACSSRPAAVLCGCGVRETERKKS